MGRITPFLQGKNADRYAAQESVKQLHLHRKKGKEGIASSSKGREGVNSGKKQEVAKCADTRKRVKRKPRPN